MQEFLDFLNDHEDFKKCVKEWPLTEESICISIRGAKIEDVHGEYVRSVMGGQGSIWYFSFVSSPWCLHRETFEEAVNILQHNPNHTKHSIKEKAIFLKGREI